MVLRLFLGGHDWLTCLQSVFARVDALPDVQGVQGFEKTLNGRSQLQRKPVPRYYQWLARASKMGKRLEGFLPRPGLTPEVDGNCSGGCENRQGCVTECLKVEKLHKT